jgi:drug/metabolite transporter (DMT)-like permease
MGVVYGLLAAVFWGVADFMARLAAERIGSRRTTFYMQAVAWMCVSLCLLVPSTWPSWPSDRVLALAAGIGLLNVCGALLLYRALEIGTVSLVSPISSTFAAVAAGLALLSGERPTPLVSCGLVVTALGVLGTSASPLPAGKSFSKRGIGLAAAAAVLWGTSFFSLRYVVRDLGSFFPVWLSRTVAVFALGSVAVVTRKPLELPRGAWRWVVGVAVFDSAAFVAYNLGVATQLTAVVTVVSSLFSAVTVFLAMWFLRERLSASQWASVVVTLIGVGLVSSGR